MINRIKIIFEGIFVFLKFIYSKKDTQKFKKIRSGMYTFSKSSRCEMKVWCSLTKGFNPLCIYRKSNLEYIYTANFCYKTHNFLFYKFCRSSGTVGLKFLIQELQYSNDTTDYNGMRTVCTMQNTQPNQDCGEVGLSILHFW